MRTHLIRCEMNQDCDGIDEVGRSLREGQLVAFPTETVYGLGANALREDSIRAVYEVKGRPQDNPLIVHLHDKKQLTEVARNIPPVAYQLLERFAPGPLTLVLERSPNLPAIVSAGLPTVAVRFPAHPVARALLKAADCPVVAPSANLSGKPSPTTADDCLEDLAGLVPYIVDGGASEIGVESTVLDLTVQPARILRPGKITAEDLAPYVQLDERSLSEREQEHPKAPGMKYRHYAPEAELILLEADDDDEAREVLEKALEDCEEELGRGARVGLWLPERLIDEAQDPLLKLERASYLDLEEATQGLYAALRNFDRQGCDRIYAFTESEEGLGCAYMNRLRKAAGGKERERS